MEASKYALVKLNNNNYQAWQFSVKMLLIREDLWDYVSPGVSPDPVTDLWRKGDQKAIATIALLVEDNQHFLIQNTITAKSTWEALQKYHSKATLTSKISLLKKVCNKQYKNGDDMEKYLFEFDELFAKLGNAGKQLDEDLKVALILRSLPENFDSLCVALEARQDEDLKLEMIRGKLIDHVQKTKETEDGDIEKAMRASANKLKCFYCDKEGHIKRYCKEYLKSKKSDSSDSEAEKKERKKKHKLRSVRESFQEFSLTVRSSTKLCDDWIVDTGASSHMCCKKDLFDSLDESHTSRVYEASGESLKVAGIGKVILQVVNDSGKINRLILNDVLYVPKLDSNLLSVRKACDNGLSLKCFKDNCRLDFGKYNVAVGIFVNNIPILKLKKETKMGKGKQKSPKGRKSSQAKPKEEVVWIESVLKKPEVDNSESSESEIDLSHSQPLENTNCTDSNSETDEDVKIQKENVNSVRSSSRGNFGVPPQRFGFFDSVKNIISKTASRTEEFYNSFSDTSAREDTTRDASPVPGSSGMSRSFEFD